jgi:hypothetical protein
MNDVVDDLSFIDECKTRNLLDGPAHLYSTEDGGVEIEWWCNSYCWTITGPNDDCSKVYIHVSDVSADKWWELFVTCDSQGVDQFATFREKVMA